MQTLDTDILILGAGGAGLFAALHAKKARPELDVTIAVKGLLGKCGCTRMVQGGYNVALAKEDSVERHFMDTIEGGGWLNHQELAWLLVSTAPKRIRELENEIGCFFDRNPDGTVHQKAFAGQTFDRTVHKGDLTGIEIINRLAEQIWRLDVRRLEDHRALDLIPAADGSGLCGVYMLDMRTGEPLMVRARATLLATGGGPTMYLYHTPSGDKSCDGMAMALRAGLPLRDMEMVQFHPTGLLAGPGTRMTGTVLEEGLRGSGGHLLDETGARFMFDYDKRGERATRDIVCRGIADRIRKGHASPNGGVYIAMGHLGPDNVRREFKGMVERCDDCGFDLAGGQGRGDPDRALHDGRRAVRTPIAPPRCRGSTRPARTPAACMAPIGSAATASPIRRCSAGSRATPSRRTLRADESARRSRQGRDRGGAGSAPSRRSASAAAISKRCGGGSIR